MTRTIRLPDGHDWQDMNLDASHDDFECAKCGATFSVDLMDNSRTFEDGGGECTDD